MHLSRRKLIFTSEECLEQRYAATIHTAEVHNLTVSGMFPKLCDHQPRKKPHADQQSLPIPSHPSPEPPATTTLAVSPSLDVPSLDGPA